MPASLPPILPNKIRIARPLVWLGYAAIDISIVALVVWIGLQMGRDPGPSTVKTTISGAP